MYGKDTSEAVREHEAQCFRAWCFRQEREYNIIQTPYNTRGKSIVKWGRRSRASEEDPDDLGCAVREERVDPNGTDRQSCGLHKKEEGGWGQEIPGGCSDGLRESTERCGGTGTRDYPNSEGRTGSLLAARKSATFHPVPPFK
jgi:hypothetical protein